jgi:hypothetical protein
MCKVCNSEKSRAYETAHRHKVQARKRAYYERNRRRIAACEMRRTPEKKEQIYLYKLFLRFERFTLEQLEDFVRWRGQTFQGRKSNYAEARRAHRRDLSDGYLQNMLVQRTPGLRRDQIPKEFLSAKRAHISVKRLLKEKT